jgi:hypothetical protein
VLETSLEWRTRLNIPGIKNREAGELKNIFIHRLGDSGNRRAQPAERGPIKQKRVSTVGSEGCSDTLRTSLLSARVWMYELGSKYQSKLMLHTKSSNHLRSLHVHR